MKKLLSFLISCFLFIISYSQNIGIGTNSPNASAILDISSTNKGLLIPRMTAAQMNAVANPATGLLVFNLGDSSVYVHKNSGWSRLVPSGAAGGGWLASGNDIINSNTGNVIIGSSNQSVYKLNITGTDLGQTFYGADDKLYGSFENNNGNFQLASNYGVIAGGSPAKHILLNPPAAFGNFFPGNVGINTTNPVHAKLEINGGVGNTVAIFGGDGTGVALEKNWPAVGFNHYFDGSNHRSIGQGFSAQLGINQVNGSLYLASWPYAAIPGANLDVNSYTQRFYVSRFGKIGIGTDDPRTDLHIVQRSYSTDNSDPTAWENGITLQSPESNYWNINNGKVKTCVDVNLGILDPLGIIGELVNGCTTYGALVFQYNGISRSCIRSDGEYRQMSDARYKKNISSINYCEGLAAVMQLNPVKYNFKDETDLEQRHYGFLAQDVEKIFPQFVDNINDHKVLGYQSFIPVLTKAVQEQQQQIDRLENEIAELKKLVQAKK
ncbi:MAG: tail fiber domain-containing protein [Ferruginibacter sp.]